ncbi:hypothetical protein A3F06_00335 [candidate division TM6 bacterium RIFCSPHIGHO2_12_FULL_36_22]|nr:MAG: hypothetical protein A3F06_00335 [candidate division TM6 bacterium RIFCSPHIGHO2_12_FULL_36_22]
MKVDMKLIEKKNIQIDRSILLITAWFTCLFMRTSLQHCAIDPFPGFLLLLNRQFNQLSCFIFMLMQFFVFDYINDAIGGWTLITAISYASIAVYLNFYTHNKRITIAQSILYTATAAICFDAITLWIGPLYFGQPITSALIGQIPFTIDHVIRACLFNVAIKAIYEQTSCIKNKQTT